MHQVRYKRSVLDTLAEAWVSADTDMRQLLTTTSNDIHRLLTRDPYANSESRDEGVRVMIVPPLGVNYVVDDQTKTVRVTKIWLIRSRNP